MEATAPKERSLRIVLICRYTLHRLGLVRLLEGLDKTTVVAHTGTGAEGAELTRQFAPDVVLVDAELADEDDMELITTLKKSRASHIMLVADTASPAQIERALEAGADGYMLKDIDVSELASALVRLAHGDTVLHPEAASALARSFSPAGRGKTVTLTPRQREILRLIASGLENKQIARKLGIGVHTVKTHVSRVLHKLDANSRTEAVVTAMKERLIS